MNIKNVTSSAARGHKQPPHWVRVEGQDGLRESERGLDFGSILRPGPVLVAPATIPGSFPGLTSRCPGPSADAHSSSSAVWEGKETAVRHSTHGHIPSLSSLPPA